MPNLFNDGTNRQGLIVWGGARSSDYGIVVENAPAFDKTKRKQTIFNVPNRNGSVVFQQDAFEDVVRSYNVWIADDLTEDSGGGLTSSLAENIAKFTAILYSKKGYQELEDNFEPDYFRLAYYSGGNNFSNEMMQFGRSTLQLTCRPERFLKSGKAAETVVNGDTLTNPTLFTARPLIHIEGAGNISIAFGDGAITALDVDDYINIDCERMNAYREPTENMNAYIQGTFPNLLSGENEITITGTTTLVQITPRYFTM